MRIQITVVIAFILILFSGCSNQKESMPVTGLLERVAPEFSGKILFEEITSPDGKDLFELESAPDGKIIIRGNNQISLAVGLNHYLNYYCNTHVSWFASQPVELPETLPDVLEKVRLEAKVERRFFLNYCTSAYTLSWWKWRDWERLIDWMALNGINMSLATTGQESVWYNVWKEFGLTDEEIRGYFTGPAHLFFHRMSLLDSYQGPLPHSWLDSQLELQKKILARERELGITPVLQAFNGHVPREIKRLYPDAKIAKLRQLEEYDLYRPRILDPSDSLYPVIQKAFMEEQERLFGTDHVYGADPFSETKPQSWDTAFLADLSKTIYGSMIQNDPEAEWLQMAWVFYFDPEWNNERLKAYLRAVPQDQVILLDYYCEHEELWKTTESFFGQPYLWCYLGNFGGNTMLMGNMQEVANRIAYAIKNGGSNMSGVGSTLEALDVNPLMYEYVFEQAWESNEESAEEWITRWADRRCGYEDENVRASWKILLDQVYQYPARLGQGMLTNARPSLAGHGNWTTTPHIDYDNAELFRAWELMLQAKEQSRDAYCYDVVNIGRQVLGNHFQVLRDRFTGYYHQGDIDSLKISGERMLELLADLDRLLGTHQGFLLGKWLEEARAFGADSAEAAYYEKSARMIITTWAGEGEHAESLNDYANRSWAGLTESYYAGRWKMFVERVNESLEKGEAFTDGDMLDDFVEFEGNWVRGDRKFSDQPVGDPVSRATELMEKYREVILKTK
ncbi:MAG: alpha-N-acetylglucosaminidase [Bacteroidota bacterium]